MTKRPLWATRPGPHPGVPDHLRKYMDYIRNTGQVPLLAKAFKEDWEPIGVWVLKDLVEAGLIYAADLELHVEGSTWFNGYAEIWVIEYVPVYDKKDLVPRLPPKP